MPARHVFISYSHQDKPFVERLEQRLQKEGIDIWRDEKDATAGRLERQINDAIFEKDALLLVFSQHSCGSDWVEWEASRAREVEKQEDRDVLCPIALDDAWKTATWRGPLQFQIQDYNILDFSDPGRFDGIVDRLIAGLRSYYGP